MSKTISLPLKKHTVEPLHDSHLGGIGRRWEVGV